MFCNKCGNQINEGEKFCTQCGEPVIQQVQELICPVCNHKLEDGMIFCSQCGTKVGVSDFPYTPENNGGNTNDFNGTPKTYRMISKYVGEPSVGISKATGSLLVYQDRLEFNKQLGNALGGVFGIAGLAVAAKKAKTDGNSDVFYYKDIKEAYVSKYMAVMPAVVIMLNDGQVFSFNGTFTQQSANEVVNIIMNNK